MNPARAMSDDTARHQVNHAQVERGRQAREHFEDSSPVAPAVKNIDRSVEFLDLVTACHAFVAAAGRAVPGMRDRPLGDDEPAELQAYEVSVIRGKLTEIRRFITGTVAPTPCCNPKAGGSSN